MGNDKNNSDEPYARRALRAITVAAKGNSLYILGADIDGKHYDLVCIGIENEGTVVAVVPVARLLDDAETQRIKDLFAGGFDDETNTGHA